MFACVLACAAALLCFTGCVVFILFVFVVFLVVCADNSAEQHPNTMHSACRRGSKPSCGGQCKLRSERARVSAFIRITCNQYVCAFFLGFCSLCCFVVVLLFCELLCVLCCFYGFLYVFVLMLS